MNLKQQIQDFLIHKGAFREGVKLYRLTGRIQLLDKFQAAIHLKYVVPSIRRDLEQALEDWLNSEYSGDLILTTQASSNTSSYSEASSNEVDNKSHAPPTSADIPPVILSLKQKGRALKKREAFLHAQLVTIAAVEESDSRRAFLHEIANELMEKVEPELDEVYNTIAKWEDEGILPASGRPAIIRETVEKMKRRDSLRSSIYQIESKLRRTTLPSGRRQTLEKDLLNKQVELKKIEADLLINE